MIKLSIEEYLEKEKTWLEKNGMYYEKLIAINKQENEIVDNKFNGNADEYLKSPDAAELEKQRNTLKEEFKGYVNHYKDPDFYCLLKTDKDIEKAINQENTKKWMHVEIKNIGKIMTDGFKTSGKFEGIICAIDDYYYLLKDEKTGKDVWVTCVGKIEEYEKPKSYQMVTNGKDYI